MVIKPPLDLPDKLSRLSVLSASIGSILSPCQLSRGFAAGSPAWGSACFSDAHTATASNVPGSDPLVQSHPPVQAPPKQPSCLAKPVVEAEDLMVTVRQHWCPSCHWCSCTNLRAFPALVGVKPPEKPVSFVHRPFLLFPTPKFAPSISHLQISLH